MTSTSIAKYNDKRETLTEDEVLERLAYATTRALAREALIYNMEDALDALKRLWKHGALQRYIDKIPELKELVRLGKLP